MKNIFNSIGILVFILLLPFVVFANTNRNSYYLNDSIKKELINITNILLLNSPSIQFSINRNMLKSDFKFMKEEKIYNDEILNSLMDSLKIDPNNPIYLNNIADFYSVKQKKEISKFYFQKAKQNLNIKYFNNDSSRYYSLRGNIRANLNDSNAYIDYENALNLNPNDSIALIMYPFLMISINKYDKARNMYEKLLEVKTENTVDFYICLIINHIFESMNNIRNSLSMNKLSKKE